MGAKENTHLKGTMYEIYHSEHDDQWRYTLGTIGKRPLITIGLNPSTATQEKLETQSPRWRRWPNSVDSMVSSC